jgi:hypothetical protein
VLPGPEAASPPIEQKSAAIWQKHTANSNFNKIPLTVLFRDILHFSVYLLLTQKENCSYILTAK